MRILTFFLVHIFVMIIVISFILSTQSTLLHIICIMFYRGEWEFQRFKPFEEYWKLTEKLSRNLLKTRIFTHYVYVKISEHIFSKTRFFSRMVFLLKIRFQIKNIFYLVCLIFISTFFPSFLTGFRQFLCEFLIFYKRIWNSVI